MRVLSVIIIPPHMKVSGAVNAAMSLNKMISKKIQLDVAVMSEKNSSEYQDSLRIYKFKSFNFLSYLRNKVPDKYLTMFYTSKISNFIKKKKYDLVHFHNILPSIELKRCATACIKENIPYIISSHGFNELLYNVDSYNFRFYEKLFWYLFIKLPLNFTIKNAKAIFTLYPDEKNIIYKKFRFPKKKIFLITNGVNENKKKLITKDNLEITLKKFKINYYKTKNIPIYIFVGNHTPNKGIDALYEIFSKLNSEFYLIICGSKRPKYKNLYDKFYKLNQKNQKIIITDYLNDFEIINLMHTSNFFIYPTRGDTLPLVILDAMMIGLPVISTKVGGIPYQLKNNCGCIIDPNNISQAIKLIKKLESSKSRRIQISKKAKRRVLKNFSWNNSASQSIEIYNKIII